ncbi:hypothetical protein EPR50_G00156540 [Perca flavescens]|uniref:Arf-GAP with coiled-coil, ANK repeat and PH domain-containing protein n=1 Tax=Perca flavescens TaxID=8167 RepID=A0A484CGX4_PERFV|nr:hypothetical protein EPR50_G00156540 [Perca flavescens]
MSLDGTKLLFEGFLQKRKDTLKIKWVTYWFRLQNTTLFFYTRKNGSAAHLRGYYYIYTVQSVREVQRVDSKRFMFEIIMTNGKRKLLAAETAALRKEWVGLLWQAMNLSTSGVSDSRSTQHEVCEQRERLNSSAPISSHSERVMELLPARPLSAPTGHVHHKIKSIASPICLSEEPECEEAMQQNTLPACSYQHYNSDSLNSPQWSSGLSNAEGDYDILPRRTTVCEISASTETDEGVYDFPLSYRRSAEHANPTESIYDVPSSLLRRMPDHTLEEQLEDEVYWRI